MLIVTDDLDARSLEALPRLRSLVAEPGLSFSNAFVTTGLCAPSRASILTGRYAHDHGTWANVGRHGGFRSFRPLETAALPARLRAAGYRTALIGKYLNGYPPRNQVHVPPGWDEWHALFSASHYTKYYMVEGREVVRHGNAPDDYETDLLARAAADFVRRSAPGPFFLYLAPSAPHRPASPAKRHEAALPDLPPHRPPSFDEVDVSDKPAWVSGQRRLAAEEVRELDELYRKRLQTMLAVEDLIQTLLATLAETGQLGRTYVVFTSDNGFHLGEHRLRMGKASPYDESTHVPLAIRGPGVPAGRVLDALVLNIDLAETIAELAGAELPEPDGRSLVPLLRGAVPPDWRRDALFEHWPEDELDIPEWQALRTPERLYVEYATGERELYDIGADPYQLDSLVRAAPAAELARLGARLAALRKCRGEGCR